MADFIYINVWFNTLWTQFYKYKILKVILVVVQDVCIFTPYQKIISLLLWFWDVSSVVKRTCNISCLLYTHGPHFRFSKVLVSYSAIGKDFLLLVILNMVQESTNSYITSISIKDMFSVVIGLCQNRRFHQWKCIIVYNFI